LIKLEEKIIAMKMVLFLSFLLALTGCVVDTSSQPATAQRGYKDWFIKDFRCGVYIPPTYDTSKKYPLVIYLHGKDDTTTVELPWYNEPAVLSDPCIVLSPKCPSSETRDWGNSLLPILSPMMEKTFEMIKLVREKYKIDEDRIYIYGISMGAYGTYNAIQTHPGFFAGGYAVCGWGNPKMADQLSKIPFWIFHGEKDDAVPVDGARGIYNAVVEYGGKQIRYTEFPNVKHDAWNYLDNSEICKWLLSQKKGAVHMPPPKVINVNTKLNIGKGILVEWTNATRPGNLDDRIWYYKIYRNNSMIAEVEGRLAGFSDLNVQPGTVYEYKVSAVNYNFKESEISMPVRLTNGPK
jgi:hypothetical protein